MRAKKILAALASSLLLLSCNCLPAFAEVALPRGDRGRFSVTKVRQFMLT